MTDLFSMKELETIDNYQFAGQDHPAGCLDGVTILRYAHIERDRASGGVEQYLRHLHRGLLQKHRMTILQMHLTKDSTNKDIEREDVGVGRIFWIPVPVLQGEWPIASVPKRLRYILDQSLRRRQEGRSEEPLSVADVFRQYGCHLRHATAVLSNHLSNALRDYRVDLLMMHWLNYDSDALIAQALDRDIPFAFINHFDNSRLALPQNRKWIAHASAIGTVSSRGIPAELRDRCVALSDAVDTEFFAPEKASRVPVSDPPMILLPARIDTTKGHDDLLEIARILIARGAKFSVRFVGAVECEPLYRKLRRRIAALGLEGQIDFLGERSAEEIRDLYAASTIVALPSHSEGLGRVLLEAQAMKKPVVAYDCGGVSEAIVPNETGLLLDKGNLQGFADKLNFFLDNESERLSYGERGRAFVCRRFSIPALVQRHETFYMKALARTNQIAKESLKLGAD